MINKAKIEVDFDEIARATEGMSFRDLEKLCNYVFYKILQGNKTSTSTFCHFANELKSIDSALGISG